MALPGLEKLAATHEDCKIGGDMSPPIYAPCKAGRPLSAAAERHADRDLPYFRQVYDFDGMTPAAFCQVGPFAAPATEFAAATHKPVDFDARAPQGAGVQSA